MPKDMATVFVVPPQEWAPLQLLLTRLEGLDYRIDRVGPEPEWRLYLSRTGQVPA
jgi:hypothetical protein